jgi:hypothetical protein
MISSVIDRFGRNRGAGEGRLNATLTIGIISPVSACKKAAFHFSGELWLFSTRRKEVPGI